MRRIACFHENKRWSDASIDITRDTITIEHVVGGARKPLAVGVEGIEGVTQAGTGMKVVQKAGISKIVVKVDKPVPVDLFSIQVGEQVIARIKLNGRVTGVWNYMQEGGKKSLLVFLDQED